MTKKQEKFAEEYVKTGNASEAYRRAYDAQNMKPKTINERASVLLNNDKVKTRVSELQEKAKQIAEREFDYDVKKLQETLISWINADITETIELSPSEVKDLPKEIRKLITSYKHNIAYTKNGTLTTIELKFVSKEKAAEMLAKHFGLYEEHNKQKNLKKTYIKRVIDGKEIYEEL